MVVVAVSIVTKVTGAIIIHINGAIVSDDITVIIRLHSCGIG